MQFQEGKESLATAELYKVLKDHKNPFMQDLVSSSFKHCYQARKAIGHDGLCTQEPDECGTENVVRVTLVNPKFHTSLLSAVELLTEAKLQLDKFGFEFSTTTSQASTSQLAMTCDRYGKTGLCKLSRQAFLLKPASYEKTLPKQQNKHVFLKSTVIFNFFLQPQ